MTLRKILIRIGLGLLVLVALVLVVRAVLNFTEGRALAKTLAGLKAKGIPLTARDLAPPCPDEDNGARLWKAYENLSVIPGRLSSPRGWPLRSGASEVRGLIGRSWSGFAAGKPMAPVDRDALVDVIARNAEAFELLAEMAVKPCFLYRDPAGTLVESLQPYGIQGLDTARLLFFAALFDAEKGDVRGALERLVAGLKMAALMAREGNLMAYLVSVAEGRILSQFLGGICRGRTIDEADLARLVAVLDPGPWTERLEAAWRGERVFFVEVGGDLINGRLADLGSFWEGPRWLERLGFWALRPLVKKDLRRSLPGYEWLESRSREPYYRCREALRAHDREDPKRPWHALLSRIVGLSEVESVFLKAAQIEAIMLANRAGLACRLYKNRMGRYPERLDELVPGLLKEVPIDPFTGKPLVYRREGEGFIVYSLGSNEKDDGGRMTFNITQMVMDKDDDWSWEEEQ